MLDNIVFPVVVLLRPSGTDPFITGYGTNSTIQFDPGSLFKLLMLKLFRHPVGGLSCSKIITLFFRLHDRTVLGTYKVICNKYRNIAHLIFCCISNVYNVVIQYFKMTLFITCGPMTGQYRPRLNSFTNATPFVHPSNLRNVSFGLP